MSATTTQTPAVTLGTILGTPVLFYPVLTPWPMSPGCDKYIYRQDSEAYIIAYDPIYPEIIGKEAQSCFHHEQAASWHQAETAQPSIALGPTFVCPESWNAAQTTKIDEDATALTLFTYCCPPRFTLHAAFPVTARSIEQCTSRIPPRGTIKLVSLTFVSTGTEMNRRVYTVSTTATVHAPPVNGYNIVQKQASPSTTTPPLPSATMTPLLSSAPAPHSDGLSEGRLAGVIIGAVGGTVVLLGLLCFGWKFWRKRASKATNTAAQPMSTSWDKPELSGQGLVEADGTLDSNPKTLHEMA